MWKIFLIDNGDIQVLETFIDDAEAVEKYKSMVENRHTPDGVGDKSIYLSWIEF